MAIQFGRKQIGKPTPSSINFWIRVYTVVAGTFMGWMQTATFISSKYQAIISSIIGLTLALSNGLAPLFGTTPSDETVPVENVTAMEEPKKEV